MAGHRFKVGQTVIAHASGIPIGPYVIVRLLPLVGTDPHYHGRSDAKVVRALLESQIREAVQQAAYQSALNVDPRSASKIGSDSLLVSAGEQEPPREPGDLRSADQPNAADSGYGLSRTACRNQDRRSPQRRSAP
jgi:hypothetical protein